MNSFFDKIPKSNKKLSHQSKPSDQKEKNENNPEYSKGTPLFFQNANATTSKHGLIQRQIFEEEKEEQEKDATFQAKITIGKPNDKYEQEADRVADQVMRMPDSESLHNLEDEEEIQTKSVGDQITPIAQRQNEFEDEEE